MEIFAFAGSALSGNQQILVTVFNLAVAGGGLLGGLAVDRTGAAMLPWLILPLILIALAVAWHARDHGFPARGRTM